MTMLHLNSVFSGGEHADAVKNAHQAASLLQPRVKNLRFLICRQKRQRRAAKSDIEGSGTNKCLTLFDRDASERIIDDQNSFYVSLD